MELGDRDVSERGSGGEKAPAEGANAPSTPSAGSRANGEIAI